MDLSVDCKCTLVCDYTCFEGCDKRYSFLRFVNILWSEQF